MDENHITLPWDVDYQEWIVEARHRMLRREAAWKRQEAEDEMNEEVKAANEVEIPWWVQFALGAIFFGVLFWLLSWGLGKLGSRHS